MNDYEICKNIRRSLLTRAGEVMTYSSWGSEFSAKYLRELPAKLEERADWYRKVDVNTLNKEQLDDLGFSIWSKELPIRLIPIWLLPFMQDSIEAQCIDGEKVSSVAAMDNDHRAGCLAYGVIPKE